MRFHLPSFLFAILLLPVEILIATVLASNKWVRGSLGDFLVVILLYFFIKAFYAAKPLPLALLVFLFACLVELAQYFQLAARLGFNRDSALGVIIGSTFSWDDVLMYFLGCVAAAVFDRYFFTRQFSKSTSR